MSAAGARIAPAHALTWDWSPASIPGTPWELH